MSLIPHILKNTPDLEKFIPRIKNVMTRVESLIEKVITVGHIDVVYYDNPEAVVEGTGFGGFAPCANVVFVSLDPRHTDFDRDLEDELLYTLAHELNHAIRFRTPIQRDTLFEAMISEGLADTFAMQITGRTQLPVYCNALSDKQKAEFFLKASVVWDNLPYDHAKWFYGACPDEVPNWTAYTLGYDLVRRYLDAHPEVSSSDLISADATVFLV